MTTTDQSAAEALARRYALDAHAALLPDQAMQVLLYIATDHHAVFTAAVDRLLADLRSGS